MAESMEKPKRIPERKIGQRKTSITKKEFFTILDRASKPVKHEAESDSGKSGT